MADVEEKKSGVSNLHLTVIALVAFVAITGIVASSTVDGKIYFPGLGLSAGSSENVGGLATSDAGRVEGSWCTEKQPCMTGCECTDWETGPNNVRIGTCVCSKK